MNFMGRSDSSAMEMNFRQKFAKEHLNLLRTHRSTIRRPCSYARLGNMDVGGVEIIGYDRETDKYVSYFYDSRGNSSEHETIVDGNTITWKGKVTSCTAVFTEKGKVQTAHHVRLDESRQWGPSMEVVLTKVR